MGLGKQAWAQAILDAELAASQEGKGRFYISADHSDQTGAMMQILKDHPQATISIEIPPVTQEEREAFGALLENVLNSRRLSTRTSPVFLTMNCKI